MSDQSITKDTTIREIVEDYPETIEVLTSYGMHCLGCAARTEETLEMSCMMHDLDVDNLVKNLNERRIQNEI